jgi:hypothetical protein
MTDAKAPLSPCSAGRNAALNLSEDLPASFPGADRADGADQGLVQACQISLKKLNPTRSDGASRSAG